MPNREATAENGYNGEWAVGMHKSPCEDPSCCLLNCILPCINARSHRIDLLGGDMEAYECFAGLCGPKLTGVCNKCTSKCPAACLCCEAFCCPALAASGTRMMIQNQFRIQNGPIDNCLICTSNLCQLAVCLCQLFGAPVDEDIKNAVDCFTCLIISCFITQVGVEIKKRGIASNAPVPGNMQKHAPPQMQNKM